MKKGFDRLRGVAAASAMGLGLLGAGSGRALVPSGNLPLGVTRQLSILLSATTPTARFTNVGGVGAGDTFDINDLIVARIGTTITNTFTNFFTNTLTNTFTNIIPTFIFTFTPTFGTAFTTITTFITTYTYSYPTTVSSTFSFTFSNTGTSFYLDAFDGVLGMKVDGATFLNPDNTVDLTGNVVTSDVVGFAAGIDAQIEYAFDPLRGGTSLGLVRALYTLTNTTGSEITTTVNIFGDLGSNANTTLQATESGDFVADDSDRWTVSSEEVGFGDPAFLSDPVLVITRYGGTAVVVPTQTSVLGGAGTDTFANDYVMTIPAGATQQLLVFVEAHTTNAGAIAAANDFETLAAADAAGLLTGISAAQQLEIVNYVSPAAAAVPAAVPAAAPAANNDDGILGIGSFSLPGLATLMGIFSLFRLGRKKD